MTQPAPAPSRYVCPDCYRPITLPKRGKDARCDKCRADLPVNGRRRAS